MSVKSSSEPVTSPLSCSSTAAAGLVRRQHGDAVDDVARCRPYVHLQLVELPAGRDLHHRRRLTPHGDVADEVAVGTDRRGNVTASTMAERGSVADALICHSFSNSKRSSATGPHVELDALSRLPRRARSSSRARVARLKMLLIGSSPALTVMLPEAWYATAWPPFGRRTRVIRTDDPVAFFTRAPGRVGGHRQESPRRACTSSTERRRRARTSA